MIISMRVMQAQTYAGHQREIFHHNGLIQVYEPNCQILLPSGLFKLFIARGGFFYIL